MGGGSGRLKNGIALRPKIFSEPDYRTNSVESLNKEMSIGNYLHIHLAIESKLI